MLSEDAAVFRRFNRMYTRFIGTLQEGFLKTEYSLAEARVLYELATRPEPTAKEIAGALGIDPGYLSRMLARFGRAGLLKRKAWARDGRYAELSLTGRGKAAFGKLNVRSEEQARRILKKLPSADRARLIRSMQTIEQIVAAPVPTPTPYILREHRIGDMGLIASREGAVYAETYGWDQTFEALVARIVSQFIINFAPGQERCWIAEVNGEAAGHIFLVRHPEQPDTAKLRLLFVEPAARGLGLGGALVEECIRFARAASYRKIVLWTQSMLEAAHHIYCKAGFRLVKEEPHHSFGKDLIGQTWELNLLE